MNKYIKKFIAFLKNYSDTIISITAILSVFAAVYTIVINQSYHEKISRRDIYLEAIEAFGEQYQKISRCDISAPSANMFSSIMKANLIEDPELVILLEKKNKEFLDAFIKSCALEFDNTPLGGVKRAKKSEELQTSFREVTCLMAKNLEIDAYECVDFPPYFKPKN